MSTNHLYLIYMYKPDLALNNLQWFICHKTKRNQRNYSHVIIIIIMFLQLCNFVFDVSLHFLLNCTFVNMSIIIHLNIVM